MVITGIIRPPPEIRAVADRTALYVAKNGRTFEQRILASEKGKTPKFAFLHLSSPFHAYYEDRIQFYIDGGDEDNTTKEGEEDVFLYSLSDSLFLFSSDSTFMKLFLLTHPTILSSDLLLTKLFTRYQIPTTAKPPASSSQ